LDYLNGFAGKKPLIKGTLWSGNSSIEKYLQPSHFSTEISGKAIKQGVMNDWPHSKPINDVLIELSFKE